MSDDKSSALKREYPTIAGLLDNIRDRVEQRKTVQKNPFSDRFRLN